MPHPIIVSRIYGGLGNQLFCYAAARRLALVNEAEAVIDDISGFTRDFAYKRNYQLDNFNIPCRKATAAERLEPLSRLRRYFYRLRDRDRPFEDKRYIQQENVDFDRRLLQVKPHGIVHLDGYWQSEGYFKDVENIIRADLSIQPPTDSHNLEMAGRIKSCDSVAVHVRFFDATDARSTNNAPADYYSRAIALMNAISPHAHYFLFSDNPDVARQRLPLTDNQMTCVAHNNVQQNAHADLWLMSQCKNFIIANSTFSWWGAWLSAHKSKQVIAPGFVQRQGVAFWGFNGLIPPEWIKC